MKKTDSIKEQYFMDDSREAKRLERKVNADEFVDKYLKKHVDSLSNANILEAGCGPGAFLQVLGDNYKSGNITGVDISEHRVNEANKKLAHLNNAKAIQADIYKLPFPDNHFDFIYSRFLFEYLQHPNAAAKELYRVCKPGGKLILQDLDNQFSFYPQLSPLLNEALKVLQHHTGFDANIGKKLFSIGRSAGFSYTDIETEMYHKVFGKIDNHNYDLWCLKLDIAFKNVQHIFQNAEQLKIEMLQALQDENSVMFSYLFTLTFQK